MWARATCTRKPAYSDCRVQNSLGKESSPTSLTMQSGFLLPRSTGKCGATAAASSRSAQDSTTVPQTYAAGPEVARGAQDPSPSIGENNVDLTTPEAWVRMLGRQGIQSYAVADITGGEGMAPTVMAGHGASQGRDECGLPGVESHAMMEVDHSAAGHAHQDFRAGLQVQITGLQIQGHLNGRSVTLVKFDEDRGRWQAKDGDHIILVQAANLSAGHLSAPDARGQDSAAPLASLHRRAGFVFASTHEGNLLWGQAHDQRCEIAKAQHLTESLLRALIEIRVLQQLTDEQLAFLIGWVPNRLSQRDSTPRRAQDIANIWGALEYMFPFQDELWTGQVGSFVWNDKFDDQAECFSYPAATSIFVYRTGSPGDRHACTCADAPAVQESGQHVWLYVHSDENGESFSWIPQANVMTWTRQEHVVLAEHLIYQRNRVSCPESRASGCPFGGSNGPPLLRCTRGQGTTPEDDLMEGHYGDVWERAEAAAICGIDSFRCYQCGLHLKKKHFSTGTDGTQPQMNTTDYRTDEGSFPEFCTVACDFCRFTFHQCAQCKCHLPKDAYSHAMWQNRCTRGATCTECQEKAHQCCDECGRDVSLPVHTCDRCGIAYRQEFFSASMWHNRTDSQRRIFCLDCEAQTPGLRCDICHFTKPVEAFSASAVQNRSAKTRTTRCLDCSRPPCVFLPNCATCVRCRQPTCKNPQCMDDIRALPPSELPATEEEARNFACTRCRYVRCVVRTADGSRCGKERGRKARAKARSSGDDYRCGECQTWLLAQRSLREATEPSHTSQ